MKALDKILVTVILTMSFSCGRIDRKFDSKNPDTESNKKRFEEFFNFYPSPDVKNIYCFADELAFDHSYQFSFNCDKSTINKIVSELKLSLAYEPNNYSEYLQREFFWWDRECVKEIPPYFKEDDRNYWFLWYDTTNNKAYYIAFDM